MFYCAIYTLMQIHKNILWTAQALFQTETPRCWKKKKAPSHKAIKTALRHHPCPTAIPFPFWSCSAGVPPDASHVFPFKSRNEWTKDTLGRNCVTKTPPRQQKKPISPTWLHNDLWKIALVWIFTVAPDLRLGNPLGVPLHAYGVARDAAISLSYLSKPLFVSILGDRLYILTVKRANPRV